MAHERGAPAVEEPEDPARRVGARIRAIRRHRGLTQAALAARIGRSTNALSALERGLTRPGLDLLHRLAAGLGVPVRDLFAPPGEDGRPPAEMVGEMLDSARTLPPGELALAAGIVALIARRHGRGTG